MAYALNIKDTMCALGLIVFLGLLLLLTRRISEGFENPMRCDLDTPCSPGLKCINGFCAKTDPKPLIDPNPVPLLGPGEPAPYF